MAPCERCQLPIAESAGNAFCRISGSQNAPHGNIFQSYVYSTRMHFGVPILQNLCKMPLNKNIFGENIGAREVHDLARLLHSLPFTNFSGTIPTTCPRYDGPKNCFRWVKSQNFWHRLFFPVCALWTKVHQMKSAIGLRDCGLQIKRSFPLYDVAF